MAQVEELLCNGSSRMRPDINTSSNPALKLTQKLLAKNRTNYVIVFIFCDLSAIKAFTQHLIVLTNLFMAVYTRG